MESEIDQIVERVELASTNLNKINFDMEGIKEEIDRLEDKQPFLVRQIALNKRKINRLIITAHAAQHEKEDADADLGAWKLIHAPKEEEKKEFTETGKVKKPKVNKQDKPKK